jgi:hypothetical protein
MIIKLQVPLASSEPNPKALVYNQDRSVEQMFPISPEIMKLMKGRPKAYFVAKINADQELEILAEATPQSW